MYSRVWTFAGAAEQLTALCTPRELTPEQLAQLQDVQQLPDTTWYSQMGSSDGYTNTVFAKEVVELGLKDGVINASTVTYMMQMGVYLHLQATQHPTQGRVHVLDSGVCLAFSGWNNTTHQFSTVEPKVSHGMVSAGELQGVQLLLLPVSMREHWFLMTFDFERCSFELFDSLIGYIPLVDAKRMQRACFEWLCADSARIGVDMRSAEYGDWRDLGYNPHMPQQIRSRLDCGPCVIMACYELLKRDTQEVKGHIKFSFKPRSMALIRKWLAYQILRAHSAPKGLKSW